MNDKQFQLHPKENGEAGSKSNRQVLAEIKTQVSLKSPQAEVDAAFTRIFLSEKDSFAEMVPEYANKEGVPTRVRILERTWLRSGRKGSSRA